MRSNFAYLFVGTLIALVVSISFLAGLFSGPEHFLEDLLFSSRPVSNDIIIAAIDSESLKKIGQWPWPRSVFGTTFEKFSSNPPKSVALDVIMSEPSRMPGDDAIFESNLKKINFPIVFPAEAQSLSINTGDLLETPDLLLPLPQFISIPQTFLGHVNLVLDKDGVARRFPPSIVHGTTTVRNLVHQAILAGGGQVLDSDLRNIERIFYTAPTGAVRRIPFWRLYEGDVEAVKDKIVLIGVTSPDLHDEKPTPLSEGTQMTGVEIQANIANMLLNNLRLRDIPRGWSFGWIWLAALLPAFLFIFIRNPWLSLALSVFTGFISLIIVLVIFDMGLLANIVHINASWILSTVGLMGYRYLREEKEKRELRLVFSKYVSGSVLREILKNPNLVVLGGEEREITVLFSDIRGFTTLSERTAPKELVRILNNYFTRMTRQVLQNHGVLDKYIGDAVMAFWGAPLEDEDQAKNAVLAAKGMLRELKKVNEELSAQGDPTIDIGIGIYTGPAVVGNIGSEERFDYTAMGDTVNVAARLEGLNKEYKSTLIFGESTKNKLPSDFQIQSLGVVNVKGRGEPVKIYTIDFDS